MHGLGFAVSGSACSLSMTTGSTISTKKNPVKRTQIFPLLDLEDKAPFGPVAILK